MQATQKARREAAGQGMTGGLAGLLPVALGGSHGALLYPMCEVRPRKRTFDSCVLRRQGKRRSASVAAHAKAQAFSALSATFRSPQSVWQLPPARASVRSALAMFPECLAPVELRNGRDQGELQEGSWKLEATSLMDVLTRGPSGAF
jgi:hypothetical protein